MENEAQFADLVRLAAAVHHKDGPKNHALWRMHPERWLESFVGENSRRSMTVAAGFRVSPGACILGCRSSDD